MAQAATICTVLRNLHNRKLQKRNQVSARRRTRRGVQKRQVQATRMEAPPSASLSGHPCQRQRRCNMRRSRTVHSALRFIRWLCFHPLFIARTVHRAGF